MGDIKINSSVYRHSDNDGAEKGSSDKDPSLLSPLDEVDGVAAKAALAALIVLDKASFISPFRWFLPTTSVDGKHLISGPLTGCGGERMRSILEGSVDAGIDDVTRADAGVIVRENHPPILNPIGDKSVIGGAVLTFQVTASDPDTNDQLSFSVRNLPQDLLPGDVFNASTQIFSWRLPPMGQFGEHNIIFMVKDLQGASDSETVKITVKGVERVETSQFTDGYCPSLVWTGSEYGMSWWNGSNPYFASPVGSILFTKMDSQGNNMGFNSQIFVKNNNSADNFVLGTCPKIGWNGNGFGIAWLDHQPSIPSAGIPRRTTIDFARLGVRGNKIGGNVEVPINVDSMRVLLDAIASPLIWDGSNFAIVWSEWVPGYLTHFTRLTSDGHEIGNTSVLSHQLRGSPAEGRSDSPLVWTGDGYSVVWVDPSGSILFTRLDPEGNKIGNDIFVTSNVVNGTSLFLAWSGNGYGMTWDSPSESKFAKLDTNGSMVGGEIDMGRRSGGPLVWTGSEFGLVKRTSFIRLDENGSKLGDVIPLYGVHNRNSISCSLAWTGREYAVAYSVWQSSYPNPASSVYLTRIIGDFSH